LPDGPPSSCVPTSSNSSIGGRGQVRGQGPVNVSRSSLSDGTFLLAEISGLAA
jgi:hypothetical protein